MSAYNSNSKGFIRLSTIAFAMLCCAAPSYAGYHIHWLNDWMARQTVYPSFVDIDINAVTAEPILQRLSPDQVERTDVSPGRAAKQLEQNPHACVGKAIRTEAREKTMLFSRYPQVIYQGYRLYVNTSHSALKELTDNGFSVDELLTKHPITLGIVEGRSYGTNYDRLFKRPDLVASVWHRNGRDSGIGLIEMFLNGRVDAIIEHPATMQNYLSQRAANVSPVSFKPSDTEAFTLGYIACSRSSKGQENIAAINQQHAKVAQQPSYLQSQLEWIEPSTRAQFIRYYNEVYQTSFEPQPLSHHSVEGRP